VCTFALVQVLAYYDTDQQYPVYGFGGIPQGQSVASHCFAINGEPLGTHTLSTSSTQRYSAMTGAYYHCYSIKCILQNNNTNRLSMLSRHTPGAVGALRHQRSVAWMLHSTHTQGSNAVHNTCSAMCDRVPVLSWHLCGFYERARLGPMGRLPLLRHQR
jgi:Copine